MTAVRLSLAVVLVTVAGAARLPAAPPVTALAYRRISLGGEPVSG